MNKRFLFAQTDAVVVKGTTAGTGVRYSYTPTENRAHENRTWMDKMYFRLFSRDEITAGSKPGLRQVICL
ncbi:hypothetical protein [Dyadobacter sandarakinus]|uniref:Uncharacterized protein n=1 Tax=Dyadobacter sandarakinus TaxID=2747268 RepID=A0ABX7I1W0_9BACT|nr:hypothetical protein [Dyadobacter sandarakinus]QRQ99682.1 hypothetical protein HWI92_01510 [Dyadobacter sandarakinus]